jgi:hypothetical protein
MAEGRCLCGALHYSVTGPYSGMIHCHCSMCRKHHGAAFATFVTAPLENFSWISGEVNAATYQSSEHGSRAFCRVCGSVAPVAMPELGIVFVPAGNLDGELGIAPQAHMFTGSKAPWYTITDTLPQHAEYPPEFAGAPTPRPTLEPAPPGVVRGSCLCGDVAFEVRGEPLRMYNCHCSRCRRGRSAAHASNIFYPEDSFTWVRGESQVADFQLPEAQYFGTAFCRRCGSDVPRPSPQRKLVTIPAGCLDDDPGMRPLADIHVASKASWFEITDALPRFDAGPPVSPAPSR